MKMEALLLGMLSVAVSGFIYRDYQTVRMHPPLSLHKHPMCAEIIELFQKCHADHPYGKFLGKCTDLKIQLDRCFRQEKAVNRKANFEESKRFKERLYAFRKEQEVEKNIQG